MRAAILAALTAITVVLAADDPDDLARFDRAVDLSVSRRYHEAIALMEQIRVREPDNPGVLWNLGVWYFETGRLSDALDTWNALRVIDPEDWRVRAKLVQVYQALGRLDQRDVERVALLEQRSEIDADMYCRDQFDVDRRRVMAFEYFEPGGANRVILRFAVLDEDGEESYHYSLGSRDSTTRMAREAGQIGPGERMYHLDRVEGEIRSSYGFYLRQPSYDVVRERVERAMRKLANPIGEESPD